MANQGAIFHAARQQTTGSNFGMVGGGTLTPAQRAAFQKRRSNRIICKKSKSNNVPPSGKQGKKGQKAKGRKSSKKGRKGKKGKQKVRDADAGGKSAEVRCPWCAKSFKQRGIKMHRNHCKQRPVGTPLRRPRGIASPKFNGDNYHMNGMPEHTPSRQSLGSTMEGFPSPRTMRLDKLSKLLKQEKENTLRKLKEAKKHSMLSFLESRSIGRSRMRNLEMYSDEWLALRLLRQGLQNHPRASNCN